MSRPEQENNAGSNRRIGFINRKHTAFLGFICGAIATPNTAATIIGLIAGSMVVIAVIRYMNRPRRLYRY